MERLLASDGNDAFDGIGEPSTARPFRFRTASPNYRPQASDASSSALLLRFALSCAPAIRTPAVVLNTSSIVRINLRDDHARRKMHFQRNGRSWRILPVPPTAVFWRLPPVPGLIEKESKGRNPKSI